MRTTFTLLGPLDFKNPCKIILPLYIIVAMILLNFDDNKTNFVNIGNHVLYCFKSLKRLEMCSSGASSCRHNKYIFNSLINTGNQQREGVVLVQL